MTDALDRACEAAWDVWRGMTNDHWTDLSDKQKDESRAEVAAALRVMAGDVHAEMGGAMRWEQGLASRVNTVLARYVGAWSDQ